jgi:hypothetical protein
VLPCKLLAVAKRHVVGYRCQFALRVSLIEVSASAGAAMRATMPYLAEKLVEANTSPQKCIVPRGLLKP